ncbi:MAG: adenylosuccinate synthase [Planctomycetes bacterium]|nr:adenylosuccinate synthase [Planctomycetota bacterium]
MTPTNGGHTCVFGLGWGDEGKGKVVDHLCPRFDLVVRFNGGANAGHTVCVGEETFALHLLPTGVLHDNVTGVIGPGVVVDPITLLFEIDGLSARGIDAASRLRISDRAHLVMAYHKLEDQLSESSAGSDKRIGTTARGIGPCYADKMRRTTAIRFADLVYDDSLEARVRELVTNRSAFLEAMYGEEVQLDVEAILADLATARDRLGSLVCDTTNLIHNAMNDGKRILFEGANGMLLDVDHGTYPFVTSSSTGPHGIGAGAGVMPDLVSRRIGALKAYSTRVGSGPFVTELKDETGDRIRQRGKEFGTTTGRPRRCGWFDAVSSAYAARLSGATEIAMLHLDTLSGFDQVGICVAYRVDDKTLTTPPADAGRLERAEPVVEMLPGWSENLRSVTSFDDLPATVLRYLDRIESLVGAPVTIAGVGPDRSQTLERSPTHAIDAAPPTPSATLS